MTHPLDRVKIPTTKLYDERVRAHFFKHSRKRARERFDIDYTPELRELFIKAILFVPRPGEDRYATILRKGIPSEPFRSVWGILYAGKSIPVVFDGKACEIVTFLTPDWPRRPFVCD